MMLVPGSTTDSRSPDASRPVVPPRAVIAIAASAGGIPALQELLQAIPANFPAAILIVQQRSVRGADLLPTILNRSCWLPVKAAEHGEPWRAGVVYVAPPDRHLGVADGRLTLNNGARISHTLSSADPLFRAVAAGAGTRAIAVVLSGSGRNGAAGVQFIRDAGGTVIAQDRSTAAHYGMPAAAIATGAVDYVLPIDRIGEKLVELVDRLPVA